MCKIVSFAEYKRNKRVKKAVQTEKRVEECGKLTVKELVTVEWFKEWMQDKRSLSKLIFHIIEQYGYIDCRDGKRYVFEDIKRDVKYYEMYPEVENKRFKAPLWVKVSGEWYFVEIYTDSASLNAFENKMAALGKYDVKGFFVGFYGIKTQETKSMLEKNDVAGLVKKISDFYHEARRAAKTSSTCTVRIAFGEEKNRRNCTYKLLEDLNDHFILEGTELETGNKHLVLLYATYNQKKQAKYFKDKYEKEGLPLMYAGLSKYFDENWRRAIGRCKCLYKRFIED